MQEALRVLFNSSAWKTPFKKLEQTKFLLVFDWTISDDFQIDIYGLSQLISQAENFRQQMDF